MTCFDFKTVRPEQEPKYRRAVIHFLSVNGLKYEEDCEYMVLALSHGNIVGCGALAGHVLKCIAVDPSLRGEGVSSGLLTELLFLTHELQIHNLFIYTKYENAPLFRGAGFWPIAFAGREMVLMENSPDRIRRYCRQLSQYRQPGKKIGAVVMNANPFTLGHRWLTEQAARQCDWLHIFVVRDGKSLFRYEDRFRLIQQGTEGMRNITLHSGSDYIISRTTFPAYFLKDDWVADECYCRIDLQIFRQYIAPALGITHRFVGNEPLCRLTRCYNQQMKSLLSQPQADMSPVSVVELPRLESGGLPVSASRVRELYYQGNLSELAERVPPSTLDFLVGQMTDQKQCN